MKEKPRPFTWAEIEWIVFCVRRGRSAVYCAQHMHKRHPHVVLMKAVSLGLRFHSKSGRPLGSKPTRTSFTPERARAIQLERWRKQKLVSAVVHKQAI